MTLKGKDVFYTFIVSLIQSASTITSRVFFFHQVLTFYWWLLYLVCRNLGTRALKSLQGEGRIHDETLKIL